MLLRDEPVGAVIEVQQGDVHAHHRKPCTVVQGQGARLAIVRIGELATECSVPTQTIRYYERRGLLPTAERTANGYRSYDESAPDRIRFIQRAQAAGLTLAEIAGVIQVRAHGTAPCQHVDGLLNDKLADVDERIGELQQLRSDLIELLDRSSQLDPSDCRADQVCHILNQ